MWRRWHPGFTRRAHCLLAGGIVAVLCGIAIGEMELIRAGVLAAITPVIAALVVGRERLAMSSRRKLEPDRVEVGERAVVQVSVTSRSALAARNLMLQDTLPTYASGRARFVLDRLNPRQTRSVGYRLPVLARGEHHIGPLHIRLTDSFGLIDRTRSFSAQSTLLVTPRVEPLPGRTGSLPVAFGDGVATTYIGSNGVDDLSTREYRDGDDLRRIHWRLTARAGTLMVRQDEQPAPSDLSLVLDLRATAHPGAASDLAATRTGPAESFEWLVSAAASLGSHFIGAHRPVTIFDDPSHPAGVRFLSQSELVAHLALSRPRRDLTAADVAESLSGRGDRSSTIALLAGLDPATAERIIDKQAGRSRCNAIVIDTAAYAANDGERNHYGDAAGLVQGCEMLRSAGWNLTIAAPGESVSDVWSRLLLQRGGRGAAGANDAWTNDAWTNDAGRTMPRRTMPG